MTDAVFATMVKDYVTALGIAAAGGWAIWRWIHAEIERRRKEMAAPDGQLSMTAVDVGDGRMIVTTHSLWRNRGSKPIDICCDHTRVDISIVDLDINTRVLDLSGDACQLFATARPPWQSYVMEPNTDSLMQEHFVVEYGAIYAFRSTLCLEPGSVPGRRYFSRHLVCIRDQIWSTLNTSPLPASANTPAPPKSIPSIPNLPIAPSKKVPVSSPLPTLPDSG